MEKYGGEFVGPEWPKEVLEIVKRGVREAVRLESDERRRAEAAKERKVFPQNDIEGQTRIMRQSVATMLLGARAATSGEFARPAHGRLEALMKTKAWEMKYREKDVTIGLREKQVDAAEALKQSGVDPDDPKALVEAADRLNHAYEYQQMLIHLRLRELDTPDLGR